MDEIKFVHENFWYNVTLVLFVYFLNILSYKIFAVKCNYSSKVGNNTGFSQKLNINYNIWHVVNISNNKNINIKSKQ